MPLLTQGNTNWKFLLIVVVLAVIIGGGILWCQETSEQPYLLPEIRQPEKVIEDETTDLIPSEIEGWQIYRNEEYGFEIRYPNNWFVHDVTNEIDCENKLVKLQPTRILFSDKKIEDCLEPLTHGWFWFSIWIDKEHNEGDIEKNTLFNGTSVNKTIETEINEMGDSPRTNIIFNYNNFGWNINYLNNIGGDPADYNFERMLSTFKFIEELCFKGQLDWVSYSIAHIQGITDEFLEEIIIQQIIKELKECGYGSICDIKSFRVSGETVDLNNDEVLEYIIYPFNSCFTGTGGGPIYIFEFIQGEWKLIGDFWGAWARPIKSRWTKGYVNLATQLNRGTCCHTIYEYVWSGETYELIKTVDWGEGTQNPLGPPEEYWELWEGQG